MKLSGLVVGTRKSGTTWIYKNLVEDVHFCLSEKVKESGFFAGNFVGSYRDYEKLYECQDEKYIIEVDASVCYSNDSYKRILEFAPDSKIIIVFREPSDYLVSRYIHSKRKGEIKENSLADAVKNNSWLKDELDYEKILMRFNVENDSSRYLLLPFELLKSDSNNFLKVIVEFITNGEVTINKPHIKEKTNTARKSKIKMLSKVLSLSAKLARKYNFHLLVNVAKKTGVLRLIEKDIAINEKAELHQQAVRIISDDFERSREIWQELRKKWHLV